MLEEDDFPDDLSTVSSESFKEVEIKKKEVHKKNEFTKSELEAVDFQGALAMFLFEDDKTICFAVRIKHVRNLELDKTFNYISALEDYSVVVVAEEGSGDGLHQHLLLRGRHLTREKITTVIKAIYPDCRGNKCFSISEARDKKQLLKYTLKEGEYLAKGIPEKVLAIAHKLSNPKTDLKKKVVDNEEMLLMGKIDLVSFTDRYLQIKVEHSQAIYPSHVSAYVTRLGIAAGEINRRSYAQSLVDKILQN